jgi:hypothetical protein
MVRFPPGWRGIVHSQAARAGNKLAWHPGWQGTGQQPIARVPAGRYTQRITGVPLTGGQAQGIISGFPGASGSVTSPAPFTVIWEIEFPAAGIYTLQWSVTVGGTLAAGDADNMGLGLDGTSIATAVYPDTPGTYPQAAVTFTAAAGSVLALLNIDAGTAGSVYSGTATGVSVPLSLQVGPQGLGVTWYPAQVTLSTSTGPLDTATAMLWLGPSQTPTQLVGSVYTGNGTVALAIPSMSPGQVLICQWTGGHPGDQASMNVIGNMDALGTG